MSHYSNNNNKMATEKQFKELAVNLNKTMENGLKSFDKKLDDLKADLNKSIKDNFDSCIRKTERVNLKVKEVEDKVDNFIDNSHRSCKLTLTGVPFTDGEDLKKIFRIISTKLGYESSPDAILFRFKGNNNNRPICIKFPSDFYKNDYFQRYLKIAKQLTLEIFPDFKKRKDRFYLQPDLSATQYKMNKAAVKLLKAEKIKLIRIVDSNVMVKINDDDKLTRFASVAALENEIFNREKEDEN